MRRLTSAALLSLCLMTSACTQSGRAEYPATESPLALQSVVLYRNGVGYFERAGEFDGEVLRLKVRKDQVNDLLKSLTIVDRRTGKALSVSMPLDPETWANAALSTLAPGNGSLAHVLDLLRGAEVVLDTTSGSVEGRIVMIEQTTEEPDPELLRRGGSGDTPLGNDHKVTLIEGTELKVVRLSKVKNITLRDGDLAMQFHRRLDATAGEGMFQQIEVAIRLAGTDAHDLVVSYVVEAPMWKPTYRVVLPENGKGEALLQAWAVVDNTSGEDWRNVKLALTAGAPIAFQYDMHTPRRVPREDLTHRVHARRARVAMGETTFSDDEAEAPEEEAPEADDADKGAARLSATAESRPMGGATGYGLAPGAPPPPPASAPARRAEAKKEKSAEGYAYDRMDAAGDAPEPAFNMESLRRSTVAQAKASQASGLTRFDIGSPVTVPDGSSTMVAIVNQAVQGEEAFMFDPRGGGGAGYEQNPYRVVRFKNTTPFVLEPGPIAIYSGRSFVGEGISEVVGAGTSATIPFAVEPGIMVTRETPAIPQELKLLKIVRGTIHVERFDQVKTVWKIKTQKKHDKALRVIIRHPRISNTYQLKERPPETEDVPGAFMVPVTVAANTQEGGIELIEQTPTKVTVSVWDHGTLEMFERALVAQNFSAQDRAKLEPIVELRREVGKIDSQIASLRRQEDTLNRRIEQHRHNLKRLESMKGPEAQKMRQERMVQLEEFTREGDQIARQLVTLEETREQLVIKLEDKIATLTIEGAS